MRQFWQREQCNGLFGTDIEHTSRELLHRFQSNPRLHSKRNSTLFRVPDPTQWKYVNSESNPAGIITRGTIPQRMLSSTWPNGPLFLVAEYALEENPSYPLEEGDPEIRAAAIKATTSRTRFGAERFTRFSRWSSLRRALATLILKAKKLKRKSNLGASIHDIFANEFKEAELLMIKNVQQQYFFMELNILENKRDDLTENQSNQLRT